MIVLLNPYFYEKRKTKQFRSNIQQLFIHMNLGHILSLLFVTLLIGKEYNMNRLDIYAKDVFFTVAKFRPQKTRKHIKRQTMSVS